MTLRWQNEQGEKIDEYFSDEDFALDALEAEYSRNTICLGFIDPYGNTIFNGRQAEVLHGELEKAKSQEERVLVREVLEKWQSLCLACMSRVHTYLKFIGD
jgi:hypothetical protein